MRFDIHLLEVGVLGIGATPSASVVAEYTMPYITELILRLDGLNTTTRRGQITISLPVFGLRPMRWPFLRTSNEPSANNFTV